MKKPVRTMLDALTRHVAVITVAVITLVMVAAAASFHFQQQAADTAKGWVMHTYEVAGHIQLLLNRIKDVELGQRGYLLTGDEKLLAPYQDALKNSLGRDAHSFDLQPHHSIAEELRILRSLTKDNAIQERNLQEMEEDVTQLLAHWAAAIRARQAKPDLDVDRPDLNTGDRLMDNVRKLTGIMTVQENTLLASRIAKDKIQTDNIEMLIFSGLAGFYITLAAMVWLLARNRSRIIESEARYRLIVNSVADYAIFLLTPEGNVKSWNKGAQKIKGYKEEEIIGRHFSVFNTPHDIKLGTPEAILRTALASGKYEGEGMRVRKDGSTFLASVLVEPLYDADGRLIGFIKINRDVTERAAQEQEKAKLIAIIDQSPDFIGMADLQGRLVYQNANGKTLVGLPRDQDMSGFVIQDMHPQWAADIVSKLAIPAVYEKTVWQGETALRNHVTGEEIPVSQVLILLRNAAGEPICLATIMRDITDRKQAERAQERLMEKLISSNTELERFAFIASHDLQEPIRMVYTFSAIIAKDYHDRLDDEGKEYLQIVKEASLRMSDMVNDLLAYSRFDSEGAQFEHFSGGQALASALANLKALIDDRHAEIICDAMPELYGNQVQIIRVLQNFIANAIKYQQVSNTPRIHIGADDEGERWRILVRDNGVGIAEEFLKQIFEPFRRLHTWESIKGSGLGLSICKKVIESHNGTLGVTSVPGQGSVFYCTLPKRSPSR